MPPTDAVLPPSAARPAPSGAPLATRSEGLPAGAVDALRRRVTGPVAYPADPAFDRWREGVGAVVVVVAADEGDVTATVRIAREHGLALHVLPPGLLAGGDLTGGVLLLLHRLDDVRLDLAAGTATLGVGAAPDVVRTALPRDERDAGELLALRVVDPDGLLREVAAGQPVPVGAVTVARTVRL